MNLNEGGPRRFVHVTQSLRAEPSRVGARCPLHARPPTYVFSQPPTRRPLPSLFHFDDRVRRLGGQARGRSRARPPSSLSRLASRRTCPRSVRSRGFGAEGSRLADRQRSRHRIASEAYRCARDKLVADRLGSTFEPIPQCPDPLDLRLDDISLFEVFGWCAAESHAFRRSGGDEVARLQRHPSRQLFDD